MKFKFWIIHINRLKSRGADTKGDFLLCLELARLWHGHQRDEHSFPETRAVDAEPARVLHVGRPGPALSSATTEAPREPPPSPLPPQRDAVAKNSQEWAETKYRGAARD